MKRVFSAFIAVFSIWLLASCGGGDSSTPNPPAAKTYVGPPVTQIVVKKGERRMYLVAGKEVVRSYHVNLGSQPVGAKQYEGDGRTPEGMYFIESKNPRSRYHLSMGVSYPSAKDIAHAAQLGLRPGGDIMIHGLGPEGQMLAKQRQDWTAGCIAVNDSEIEEIFAMVNPGVPVFIYP